VNYVHRLIHPALPTFAEMKQKTIDNASAIKDVTQTPWYSAASATAGRLWRLRDAPDAVTTPVHPGGDENGELNYYDGCCNKSMPRRSRQGRKLMDVIDMHWYPEQLVGGKRIIQFDGTER